MKLLPHKPLANGIEEEDITITDIDRQNASLIFMTIEWMKAQKKLQTFPEANLLMRLSMTLPLPVS